MGTVNAMSRWADTKQLRTHQRRPERPDSSGGSAAVSATKTASTARSCKVQPWVR